MVGSYLNPKRWLPQIEPQERLTVIWAFVAFFVILASYYMIRPVREVMGSRLGTGELKWLFLAVFLVMLAANPIYSSLVARLKRGALVHLVYRFFACCLVGFWFVMRRDPESVSIWVARVFFVWVSVFNLFTVSLFWSFLADTFHSEQAKRLFGLIAAGGTIGGIVGSLAAQWMADHMELAPMLLVPALVLELSIWCMQAFDRVSRQIAKVSPALSSPEVAEPTGGTIWEGITAIFTSPYLLGICLLLVAVKLCATTGYFQQAEIVEATGMENEQRLKLFAQINLAVQVITIVLQSLVVGKVMRWLGLPFALMLLPFVYAISFLAVSFIPTLSALVASRIAQRSIAFGIMVPAQEALFTVVTREQKYKAKSFIDTAVTRGGDSFAGWVYDLLRAFLSLPAVSLLMVPIALLGALLGQRLGRSQRRMAVVPETRGLASDG